MGGGLQRWSVAGRDLELTRPLIMGIINVTPDSFSDGGALSTPAAAVERGLQMMADGADLIDIGGESTRPGADPVAVAAELDRVMPVIEPLVNAGVLVSLDTSKAEVAAAGLAAGVAVINDVTAGADPEMASVVAAGEAGFIAMHMLGDPRTMQDDPRYQDVVVEVGRFLSQRARQLQAAGVPREAICLDPGIGFGKTGEHNLTLLRRLPELVALGYPVMIGTSRKSFLGRLTGHDRAEDRDFATAVSVAMAVARGASVVRVHNVPLCREAVKVAMAIVRPSGA
ncbi:MAG TPA: dihydropteroate synthase [Acidimicrobiia bacterium]|jgi:dihydropteroate synthase